MPFEIIASPKNWIESSAVEQLSKTSQLPGMQMAIGMPDLHPGKDSPIGAVFASSGIIHPRLVGNDIGCGIGLWKTQISASKLKLDKWSSRLQGLESKRTISPDDLERAIKLTGVTNQDSLGTVGGGNHFAELQRVIEVVDEHSFKTLQLDPRLLYILVHSGSRGLGERIWKSFVEDRNSAGIVENDPIATEYIQAHDKANQWAGLNRKIIALNFAQMLHAQAENVLDVSHNHVEAGQIDGNACWLHRKGAAPTDRGCVVIPGSRGALSYLVSPTSEHRKSLYTVAHGAGRKWSRSQCRGRLENKYTATSLERTKLGSRVICSDKALLFEEAPEAYKDIDIVVQDLVDANLVTVVAKFAPLITYKRFSENI